MLKIRRSRDRLIFNMGIPILVRPHLYIETVPRASAVIYLSSYPVIFRLQRDKGKLSFTKQRTPRVDFTNGINVLYTNLKNCLSFYLCGWLILYISVSLVVTQIYLSFPEATGNVNGAKRIMWDFGFHALIPLRKRSPDVQSQLPVI